ncbi:tyrosine-type recombinase/integrase [Devosia honganensis]|uniref:Tyrosine-type recombinase/integrase n=1 Tax=Devosia honganensis TaxID=1610527 RepID=A0ABV7X4J2_9HYPH
MLVKLVGIHKVKAKLASGERVTYYYAWRGGPRINAKPNTRGFLAEYHRLTRARPDAPGKGTLSELVREYLKSPAYRNLAASTKKSYDWAIDKIEAEYFDLPIAALGERGARKMLLEWRDTTFTSTPRAGDMVMAVLSKIIAFAVDREDIDRHPLEKIAKLADSTRKDVIWTDEQVAAFKAKAPARMVLALELARWTGQRQGDLLALTWSAYDGTHITLRQGKTGTRVRVKVAQELKALLDAQKRTAVTILTNRSGRPYTEGFRSSWAKAMEAAGVKGVTFHDLRGTFVTLAHREGASIREIAEVTGHSEKDAETIIRKHYLAGDSAVTRLEKRNEKLAKL